MVGLHVPAGGGLTSEPVPRVSTGARRRDADPTGAAMDALEKTSVFVHPGSGGALCCSPNNVRICLKRPAPLPVATVWATCVRGAGAAKPPRACVSLHWLVTTLDASKALQAAATEATSLHDFLIAASREFGQHSSPCTAAAVAC